MNPQSYFEICMLDGELIVGVLESLNSITGTHIYL